VPKLAKELSAVAVKRLSKTDGWHFVGGAPGLFLKVQNPAASWVLRIRSNGSRKKIGLGSYTSISLAQARAAAIEYRSMRDTGIDPLAEKRKIKKEEIDARKKRKTFDECVNEYLSLHLRQFSNEKHRRQWISTLQTYASPLIGNMKVADITKNDVLVVMNQPIRNKNKQVIGTFWEKRKETSKRLLDRIRRVIDFAIVSEYRTTINPAIWKGYLDTQLAKHSRVIQNHFPALRYQDAKNFLVKLRKHSGYSCRALEFLIFVGVRSGAVRNALWSNIDLRENIWTIPPEHNKTREIHRVPLSDQAISLLKLLPRVQSCDIVFPNKSGKILSDMALSQIMKRMFEAGEIKSKSVPHGLRATFRSWAADMTSYPDEIRKAASGHAVSDQVLKAYQRTDFFDQRRSLMQDWADYIDPPNKNTYATKKKNKG